jgi:uncharacterized membrane protein (UPF0127 family)
MKKTLLFIVIMLLSCNALPSFSQTNSTQDFKTMQQQKNENSPALSYAVFYITENDACSDSEYKSLKFYQIIADEYLSMYGINHDLQGSLCVPLKNYQSYFSGLSTFTLPIVISDNKVGQQLVQQGYYGMYEITGTGKQVIYVCSCDPNVESWAGAWILSHELSHFSLRYFGEPDNISVTWVHYIQALENDCQQGNFGKVCPMYSASVTSPTGNQVPVMEVYGQGPSTTLPKDAPQSEVSTLGTNSTIIPVSNPTCQTNQICLLPGDYVSYQVTRPNLNQTVRFDFVAPADNKQITVKTTVSQNGTNAYEYDTLDLAKSIFTRPGGLTANFMYVLPTPLNLNTAYHQSNAKVGSYDRTIMSAQNTNQTYSILVQIDKETGILTNLAISSVTNTNGTVSVTQESYKLIGTNKISASNYAFTTPQTEAKQNAKSWSDGSISDDIFMQYLISNGIVKSSTQGTFSVPSWVKTDAKFWYSGAISDTDFASAIQYLVSHGVIHTQSNLTQSGFPTGKVKLGGISLDVDIADTPQRQVQGLQYHTVLSYSQGMLFPFAQPQVIPIWMKDMQFPIDIIWFDISGNILHVEKNAQPCVDNCAIYGQDISNAKYVLEVASGFVDKFGINSDSVLQIIS